MLREMLRLLPLVGTIVFIAASVATAALLVRAEWTRRPNGRRRPPRVRSQYQAWPDPAAITPAGRPFERMARRTAVVAVLALGLALLALAAQ
jgi:hypothetical protein